MIYLLITHRITFAKCQSLFIINLSISDVLVSILGVFRGLGIIDSRFVGAPDGIRTPLCTTYTILLRSLGLSNLVALLPLTIDRAIAVIFPLRHESIITYKTCVVMFAAGWLSIVIVQINNLVDFLKGKVTPQYFVKYHRCILVGKSGVAEQVFLFIIPFTLILLLYGYMLLIIVKTKRSCGHFLVVSFGIISTNLVCIIPEVITDIGKVNMGYKVTQVFYVTLWYVNGVLNPLIYVASHPRTINYVKSKLGMLMEF